MRACFWFSYTPLWCELTRTEFEHLLVSRTPCSHSYKNFFVLAICRPCCDVRVFRCVWRRRRPVLDRHFGPVDGAAAALRRSGVEYCVADEWRKYLCVDPPSALRGLCRGSSLCVRSFCVLFTAFSTPFHSLNLPTPVMSSRLSGSCGRGGSVGAGRPGSLFAHGSGMSLSRSGSSCANLRVLYAGSVLAVVCDAFASAACPASGAGLAMLCHLCGEPMPSSCSAAVISAPCRNSTGRHVPCRQLHCCQ